MLTKLFSDEDLNNLFNWPSTITSTETPMTVGVFGDFKIEMPGVPKEKVSVTVKANELRIKWTDRHGATRQRYLTIPSKVDLSKVTSTLKDGLLTVTIPKPEEEKASVVNVEIK
jgi:HSP20 family protein